MPSSEMVIFTRTFDLLSWLLPVTNHFPRAQRFTLTQRLLNAAFDLREHLEAANAASGRSRRILLEQADLDLNRVRTCLRLAAGWDWLSEGQYGHAAGMVTEIGRLLGGWKKATISGDSPPALGG